MNTVQMLENSHVKVIEAVDDLAEAAWDKPGACGEWSVKDVIAHLASYERVIIDVLKTFSGDEPTPYVLRFFDDNNEFNNSQVESRKYNTAQQVLNEYNEAQVLSASLLAQIPAAKVQQVGTIPWYNQECCLADFINVAYTHTVEHCDQIIRFRQQQVS